MFLPNAPAEVYRTLLAIVIANHGASSMAPRREKPSIARELLTAGVFRLKPL